VRIAWALFLPARIGLAAPAYHPSLGQLGPYPPGRRIQAHSAASVLVWRASAHSSLIPRRQPV